MRLLAALDRYWFAPASLRDLALMRILAFGSQTLLFVWYPVGRVRPLAEHWLLATTGAALYEPLPVLRALLPFGSAAHHPPSPGFLTATLAVAVVAGVLATIGLWARAAMPVAAAANLLLVAHDYSYGEYHHAEALMLIALGVLALAPSAAVWSVDAARRRRRTGEAPEASVFARWPLRLIQWVMALTYLSAAGAKLAAGGLAWFNGYTMTFHFMVLASDGRHPFTAFLAALPPRAHVPAAVLAWLFEALFVVAVLVPRTAWLFVLGGVALHVSVYASMDIAFFQTMLLYGVFVDSLRRYPPRLPGVRRHAPAG